MNFSIERAAFRTITVSMLALVVGSVEAQQPSVTSKSLFASKTLFRTGAISDDIGGVQVRRLTYSPGPQLISVVVLPRMPAGGGVFRRLDRRSLQVWILRPNGTTVPQKTPSVPRPESVAFFFDDIPEAEIEAVMVSVDGMLFVRRVADGLGKN